MTPMASQITAVVIVSSTICSGADQRKYQTSAWLAIVRGIRRWPVNSPHKGSVTRKISPFDNVIMYFASASMYQRLIARGTKERSECSVYSLMSHIILQWHLSSKCRQNCDSLVTVSAMRLCTVCLVYLAVKHKICLGALKSKGQMDDVIMLWCLKEKSRNQLTSMTRLPCYGGRLNLKSSPQTWSNPPFPAAKRSTGKYSCPKIDIHHPMIHFLAVNTSKTKRHG